MSTREFFKRYALGALTVAAALGSPGLAFSQDAAMQGNGPTSQRTMGRTNQRMTSGSARSMRGTQNVSGDSEALATLAAIDQHEMDAAAVALRKKIDSRITDFAKTMQTDHGDNLKTTKKVGTDNGVKLVDTPAIKQMKTQGAGDLAKLSKLDGDAFGKAYMQAMVKGHQDALAKIDTLLGQTQNSAVKAHLTDTRVAVEHHLEMAKAIAGGSSMVTPAMTSTDTSGTTRRRTPRTGMNAPSASSSRTNANSNVMADNTARNSRDRNGQTVTPLDQGNSKADTNRTAQIRNQVVNSDMSTYAKNVKIVTVNGKVTLRGTVNSAEEKARIQEIAINVAGEANVDNQLEVK